MVDPELVRKAREVRICKLLGMPDNGRRIQIRCPFPDHKDNSPSFTLYANNSYKCYGCGKYGKGAIDFVKELTGCKFTEIVSELADM